MTSLIMLIIAETLIIISTVLEVRMYWKVDKELDEMAERIRRLEEE